MGGLPYSQWFEEYLGPQLSEELSEAIKEVHEKIEKSVADQVIFVPTYRRIEQELSHLFPKLEDNIETRRGGWKEQCHATSFIEFVEFAMRDVEENFKRKMNQVKDEFHTGLSSLTGTGIE